MDFCGRESLGYAVDDFLGRLLFPNLELIIIILDFPLFLFFEMVLQVFTIVELVAAEQAVQLRVRATKEGGLGLMKHERILGVLQYLLGRRHRPFP